MKAQAREDKHSKQMERCVCVKRKYFYTLYRAHLQREKQAREDAERREKELHERLERFQDEAKAAQDGMYSY